MSFGTLLKKRLVEHRQSEELFVQQIVQRHKLYLVALDVSLDDLVALGQHEQNEPFLVLRLEGETFAFSLQYFPIKLTATNRSRDDWEELIQVQCTTKEEINIKGRGRLKSNGYIDPWWHDQVMIALRKGPIDGLTVPPSTFSFLQQEVIEPSHTKSPI